MAADNRTDTDNEALPSAQRDALRAKLLPLLPQQGKAAQRFIEACLREADDACFRLHKDRRIAPDVDRRRLARVASAAGRLQKALAALDEVGHNVLAAHWAEALHSTGVRLRSTQGDDDPFVAWQELRRAIEALQRGATDASARFKGSRQDKPSQDVARTLVIRVARAYARCFERLPSVSRRADGTIAFVQILAALAWPIAKHTGCKLRIGARLTTATVQQLRGHKTQTSRTFKTAR